MIQNKDKINVDWQSQLIAVSREGVFLLLAVAAIFLLITLISYEPSDPGWRQLDDSTTIENLGGESGAFLADLLFSVFGYAAFLLGALPVLKFVQRLTFQHAVYGWLGWIWRFGGAVLLLISSSMLIHLYDDTSVLPAGAGGAIGSSIANPLTIQFGFVGASLLTIVGVIWGLTIYGDIAWLATLDALGQQLLSLMSGVKSKIVSKIQDKRSTILNNEPAIEEPTADLIPIISDRVSSQIPPPPVLNDTPKGQKKPTRVLKQPPDEQTPPAGTNTNLKDKGAATKALSPLKAEAAAKKIVIQPFEKKSQGQSIMLGDGFEKGGLPAINLLNRQVGEQESGYSPEKLESMSRLLELKLKDFGVKIEVVAVNPGPVITRFEIQPAPGVKASKITNLAKDLARSLAMPSVRVVEVIAGKSVMGLEIPNENRAMVFLGDVLASSEYQSNKSPLTLRWGMILQGTQLPLT